MQQAQNGRFQIALMFRHALAADHRGRDAHSAGCSAAWCLEQLTPRRPPCRPGVPNGFGIFVKKRPAFREARAGVSAAAPSRRNQYIGAEKNGLPSPGSAAAPPNYRLACGLAPARFLHCSNLSVFVHKVNTEMGRGTGSTGIACPN